VAVFLDQLLELRAAGDVGALADVDEQQVGGDDQRFQPGQAGMRLRAHAACSCASGNARGGTPATASAIALMCGGVVLQQLPTRFNKPEVANSFSVAAISSGVSSYSPKALGRPAFGWALT